MAARDRRLARLHRRTTADIGLSRALSARRDRGDRLLRLPVAPAQDLAPGADARLWRGAGDGGAGSPSRRPWAYARRGVPGLAADPDSDRHRRGLDRSMVQAAEHRSGALSSERRILAG